MTRIETTYLQIGRAIYPLDYVPREEVRAALVLGIIVRLICRGRAAVTVVDVIDDGVPVGHEPDARRCPAGRRISRTDWEGE